MFTYIQYTIYYRSLSQDLIFLPIRDTTGITQLVYRAETCPSDIKTMIQDLSTESVICIKGIVRKRPKGTINPHLSTGAIEVDIQKMYCLNPASTHLPFWPSQPKLVSLKIIIKQNKKRVKINIIIVMIITFFLFSNFDSQMKKYG